MWRALWTAAVNSLVPPRCLGPGCGVWGTWLCERCLAQVMPLPPPLCERCGIPVRQPGWCLRCVANPPPFERAVAAGRFDGALREAIHALKYDRVTAVAVPLAMLAAAAYGSPPAGAIVVPVPAHPRRVRARGIDHTLWLGKAMAEAWNLPCRPELLVRARDTAPQTNLSAEKRRRNVAQAFFALPGEATLVLLVDDVMTSGATATSCANALLAAGAARVDVCTVARSLGPVRWTAGIPGRDKDDGSLPAAPSSA